MIIDRKLVTHIGDTYLNIFKSSASCCFSNECEPMAIFYKGYISVFCVRCCL